MQKFKQLLVYDIPMLTKEELQTILEHTHETLLLNTVHHNIIDARLKTIRTLEEAAAADAIVTRTGKIDQQLIDQYTQLRYIGAYTTGFDNIDVKYAQGKGIKVTHVPGYANIALAEYIIGQVLYLMRRFNFLDEQVKQKNAAYGGILGFELYGKTIGIVGLGRIGTELALRLKAFGCTLLYYDIFRQEQKEKELGITFINSVDEIVERSDIISLHMPLTKETRNMISKNQIKKMKDFAILVNTARGEIVDNEALIEETNKKRIFAIADVGIAEHPKLIDKIAAKNYNIILSHHAGFNTQEAFERRKKMFLDNIKNFCGSKPIVEVKLW